MALTHVCRDWREIFISRSSLWTFFDCTSVEKTRVYLERSKTSLAIWLGEEDSDPFLNDAFLLTVPHLRQFKSLFLSVPSNEPLQVARHLGGPAPLLEELRLANNSSSTIPIIGQAMFGGNSPALRGIRLSGVVSNLVGTNISNLRVFHLRRVPSLVISVAGLLDLFERAPLLRRIQLENAFPVSSNAPPGRMVALTHLKYLIIHAQPAHAILLNHLTTPIGASLKQVFGFNNDPSSILTHLPKPSTISITFPT